MSKYKYVVFWDVYGEQSEGWYKNSLLARSYHFGCGIYVAKYIDNREIFFWVDNDMKTKEEASKILKIRRTDLYKAVYGG